MTDNTPRKGVEYIATFIKAEGQLYYWHDRSTTAVAPCADIHIARDVLALLGASGQAINTQTLVEA